MSSFSARFFLGVCALIATVGFSDAAFGQTSSTTAVTATPSSGPYGASISIAAGVSPTSAPATNASGGVVLPTGTVQFFDGTTALTTAPSPLTPGTGFSDQTFAAVFGTLDPAFSSGFSTLSADFNGDGTPDLLSYQTLFNSANGSVELQSFVSKSGGGFTTVALQTLALPVATTTDITPVVIDFNGDGKFDVLLGRSVAYGNGDGTFQAPVMLPSISVDYSVAFAADVTGDGLPDIIALNAVPFGLNDTPYTLQVTVYANQGSGNFQSIGTFPIGSGQEVSQATLGSLHFVDLNGDGKLDMVAEMYFIPAGNTAEPPTITSVLNNGDGTFAAPVTVNYTAQQNGGDLELESLQVADFNGDGKADLALVYSTQSIPGTGNQTPVLFLPGVGDGTFGTEIDSILTIPTAQLPAGNVVSTDVNLDGTLDLAFGSGSVLSGNGQGSFSIGTAVVNPPSFTMLQLMQLAGSSLPAFVYAGPATTTTPTFPLVATHNLSSTASLSSSTLATGTHSITAQYSGDGNYAASTSAPTVVNIAQVVTTMTLTSSSNPAYRGEAATITVSVLSSGNVPTGTVTLSYLAGPMSGLGGPATLPLNAQGTATFQLSNTGSLAGSVAITAAYSGNANHASSMAQLTQVFDEPVTISPSTGTITVKSGQSASAVLSVTGYAGYTGTATFTCNGLPADASCVFNPSPTSVTGATAQPVTLTVSTAGSTTAFVQPLFGKGLQTLVCGLFAGSLLLLWPRRRWTHWIGILVIGIGLIPLGCGGNSSSGGSSGSSNNTPAGTYPFTIVGPNAGQEEGAQFSLVVQ